MGSAVQVMIWIFLLILLVLFVLSLIHDLRDKDK